MGILESSSMGWNYSDPNKSGFSTSLTGDVIALTTPPKRNYSTGEIERWPNGDPRYNIALTIRTKNGEDLQWVCEPYAKRLVEPGYETHGFVALVNAIRAAFPGQGGEGKQYSVKPILGWNVTIETIEGQYSANNPRPWYVRINGKGLAPVQGATDTSDQPIAIEASQSAVQQAVQQASQVLDAQAQQPMQQQQPMAQQQPMVQTQQPVQQQPMMQQQPMTQQQAQQPMVQQQPMTQAQPAQMPMQQQPVQQASGLYDQDIPF